MTDLRLPVEFRRATEPDLAAEFAVFVAAEEELRNRRGIALAIGAVSPV